MRLAIAGAAFAAAGSAALAQPFAPTIAVRIDRIQPADLAPGKLTDIVLNVENRDALPVLAAIIACSIWDENGKALTVTYATVSNLGVGESAVAIASVPMPWKAAYKVRCAPT